MTEVFARAELFIFLFAVVLALTAIAKRLQVPYPILLVLGGLGIAFVPGMPAVQLDPELVFVLFLPPILWSAAYFTSLRDFKRYSHSIAWLAVGLVVLTTLVVGWVAHAVIPGISWAAAFCLGAIVSPPDAVAATAVLSRIGVPRQLIAILEGESLVNDASALVLYRAAVMAMVSGTFSLGSTVGLFFVVGILGIAVGLAVGWLTQWAVRHMPEGYGQIALGLLGPYLAWVTAEQLHVSAVLACVAGGLYVRPRFSIDVAPVVRIQARSVWELLLFLLNGMIFILIGLQLGPLRAQLAPGRLGQVLWWGAAVTLTAIIVRMAWMPIGARLARIAPSVRARNPMPPLRAILMSGWTAMRGVVSLATALALPLTTASGEPLPYRSEIILITFIVILGTLVIQGLTLAPLAKVLGLSGVDSTAEQELRLAREATARAALARIETLSGEDWVAPSMAESARAYYQRKLRRFEPEAALDPTCTTDFVDFQRQLRLEAITAERRELLRLRNKGEIGEDVANEVERDLDVESLRQGIGDMISSPAT